MIKFLEWLGGYFSGIVGVNTDNGSLNFIDGYAHGYQQCEIEAGIYGSF